MKASRALHVVPTFAAAPWLLAAALAVPPPAVAAGPQPPSGAPAAAAASGLAPRVDQAGGVTVKVTPRELGGGAQTWVFEVAMDTHSQDLSQDLMRVAALVDAQGRRHAPLAWEGAGPGGHHRQGLLRFKPLVGGDPEAVILEISDIGGVPVRTFRWKVR